MKRLVSAYYTEDFPFNQLSFVNEVVGSNLPAHLTENDVLIVWGGGDISPTLYNKPVGRRTGADAELSHRDYIEWGMMHRAKELGIPIIGVCRGAQMLCALAGGHLIQHMSHPGTHKVLTIDGTEVTTNSLHHQMMYPFNVKHEMLAWIPEPLSPIHLEVDDDVPMPCEPEYVYFPEVKGFSVQWHPEMMHAHSDATKFVLKTIEERVNANV